MTCQKCGCEMLTTPVDNYLCPACRAVALNQPMQDLINGTFFNSNALAKSMRAALIREMETENQLEKKGE